MPDFKGAGHLLKEYQDKPATARDPLPNPPHRATRRRREGWACPDLGSGRALSRGQRWPRDRAAFGVSALRVTIPSVIRSPASSSNRSFLLFRSFPLFDRAAGFPSPRPQDAEAGARRACQGWPLFSGHPQGSALTHPSTTAHWFDRGLTSSLVSMPHRWAKSGDMVRRTRDMGSPLPRAFGPLSGRALSRDKPRDRAACGVSAHSGCGPCRGSSRLAAPRYRHRRGRCGRPGCLHASEFAQEGPYRTDHPEDRSQALALTLEAIVQGSPRASDQSRSQGA